MTYGLGALGRGQGGRGGGRGGGWRGGRGGGRRGWRGGWRGGWGWWGGWGPGYVDYYSYSPCSECWGQPPALYLNCLRYYGCPVPHALADGLGQEPTVDMKTIALAVAGVLLYRKLVDER